MEGGSERLGFRIIDVHLSDDASLDFSLLFRSHSLQVPEDDEEEAVVDESVQQEMRALGLPTRFSSVPPKTHSRRPRRRRKSHQVTSSLYDDFSHKLCACVTESLESPFDSVQVSAVQLDGDDGSRASDSEANQCAGEDIMSSSRDHQEGKSVERVCVSIDDDHVGASLGAIDDCGILAQDGRVQGDVTTIDELGTLPNSRGWLAYERADGGGPNGEKDTIFPDVNLELDGKTKVSINEATHCADENIVASSRIHQEGSSLLELTSIKGACVSVVDNHGTHNDEASLLSCGVIDGASSCGMVDPEAINEFGAVLNSRQPLAKERARISNGGGAVEVFVSSNRDLKEEAFCRITAIKDGSIVEAMLRVSNDGEEAFGISNSRAAAQDEQILTLNGSNQKVVDEGSIASCDGSNQKVVDEGSIASCDARANGELAEQEILIEDSQILTPEVSSWSACWDDYYGRYYFYNTETLESTWEPPKGFESYAYISAVEDNNEAFQNGLVNGVSNSEELVAKESKEERVSSEDGSKSDALLHEPLEVDALPTLSATKEASSSGNHLESLQSNLVDVIDGNLPLKEVTTEGPVENVAGLESSFCQAITYSAGNNSTVQVDAATRKFSEPTRRAKMAASWLVRLENQRMDIAATMGHHSPSIFKYWAQRFRLFSKYDLGVKLDEEGWFSVTPEAIAKHQAARCRRGVTVDAFTGVGGNAIQFALAGHYVVAIDNDPKKIEYARHNAMIYGVADCIDFVLGDFFAVSSSMKAHVVFLSPPWGGPDYLGVKVYDILTMLQPKDGISLFKVAQAVAPNIIFFLPRNVDMNQLAELSKTSSSPCSCEVEQNYLNGKLKAVTAYYGQFANMEETCS